MARQCRGLAALAAMVFSTMPVLEAAPVTAADRPHPPAASPAGPAPWVEVGKAYRLVNFGSGHGDVSLWKDLAAAEEADRRLRSPTGAKAPMPPAALGALRGCATPHGTLARVVARERGWAEAEVLEGDRARCRGTVRVADLVEP